MLKSKKRSYTSLYIVLVFLGIMIFMLFVGYRFITSLSTEQLLGSDFVQSQITTQLEKQSGTKAYSSFVPFLTEFLGFSEPTTYLVLFQNNTELRPGGGFIGSYGVLRMNQAKPEVLQVGGTESLDDQSPVEWKPVAPSILQQELDVDRWYFRDSNWAPDYKENVERGLVFYEGEGGKYAEDIDMVVAITPTVLERMMQFTGPITVQGITFEPDTVIEQLEYEVEYGYVNRGIAEENRKQILEPFFKALIDQLRDKALTNISAYLPTITSLLNEKHILLYSKKERLQEMFEKNDWAGRVPDVDGDYVQWVDANLAALKTDHAIQRSLSYSISPVDDGRYRATVAMTYDHNGTFDFRTSRYRTYARVYVPKGAVLADTVGVAPNNVTVEEYGDKTVFGSLFIVEPGEEKTLSYSYYLPETEVQMIKNGTYKLSVEKQAGTLSPGLTLDLGFDTTLTAALPAEARENWGDNIYKYQTDLKTDRQFRIDLKR